MVDLAALKKAVGAAVGPDRELDRLCAVATGFGPPAVKHPSEGNWEAHESGWIRYPEADRYSPPPHYHSCERYTASIDAALALVERKLPQANTWGLELEFHPNGKKAIAAGGSPRLADVYLSRNYINKDDPIGPLLFEAKAPTVPLAILKALLDALSALEGHPLPEKTNG